ncbi:carbamoyl-phosphate synthase [Pseudanabaena sp. FACHB-2040]|uniref:carboxylate--amine ligase n=1 Tax=Pseudanabaena sp. FACHB-2040 TaxID=2692859 RepID=UPI001685BD2C|nr:carbamoyl-phosphate synthase [Pseudanabaena sp. FACHB-2040]MBD2260928.1 carbamoyl-phosphate synthase [Pseudanabaena sp. FACHB-2040]
MRSFNEALVESKSGFRHLPPPKGFLLTMGNYIGTLAAARDLGSHGIPVVLADSQRYSLTSTSRYISRFEKAPSLENFEAFFQWLMNFGQENSGYVLYPTSDDICWLIASRQSELRKFFYLFQPSEESTYELLNKEKLFYRCQSLGIDCPETWVPINPEMQRELARTVSYPVLVKPKTQAGMVLSVKGVLCRSPGELLEAFAMFKRRFFYKPEMLSYDSALTNVMVQSFYPEASEHIYSLAGFFDSASDTYILRASEKVLQQPVKIGLGLCFESREVYEKPARQLRTLLEEVGYKGAFEVEFIHLEDEDRFLLIDFNPRFYGQMGFETARGLPLARLCYFAATGEQQQVDQICKAASNWNHTILWKHRILWMLIFFVTTKWLGGNMTRSRRDFWIRWARTGNCYDPIYAADDPKPARSHVWERLVDIVRYPRSSFYKYFCS